jgi:hypothetical protein
LASLPWTRIRLSNGAVEGMNNKIESLNQRSFMNEDKFFVFDRRLSAFIGGRIVSVFFSILLSKSQSCGYLA